MDGGESQNVQTGGGRSLCCQEEKNGLRDEDVDPVIKEGVVAEGT